jgi:hypothetical protein
MISDGCWEGRDARQSHPGSETVDNNEYMNPDDIYPFSAEERAVIRGYVGEPSTVSVHALVNPVDRAVDVNVHVPVPETPEEGRNTGAVLFWGGLGVAGLGALMYLLNREPPPSPAVVGAVY